MASCASTILVCEECEATSPAVFGWARERRPLLPPLPLPLPLPLPRDRRWERSELSDKALRTLRIRSAGLSRPKRKLMVGRQAATSARPVSSMFQKSSCETRTVA